MTSAADVQGPSDYQQEDNPDDPFSRFLWLAKSAALDLKALPQLEEAAEEAKTAQQAAEAEAGERTAPDESLERVSVPPSADVCETRARLHHALQLQDRHVRPRELCVVDRVAMRVAAVPACLQVKLSLSDELMFAYMHYQLKGDWAAMEVKMHCRWGEAHC